MTENRLRFHASENGDGAYITDEVTGLEVGLWISDWDGEMVVQVDTQVDTGVFRINVNEEPIWDQDAEEG